MNRAGEVILVSMGSIEEYRALNRPLLGVEGREPIASWSYPGRGLAGLGAREGTQVVLPDVAPVREFASGLKSIWQELEVTDVAALLPPVWVEDPLVGERDALDYVILDDLGSFAAQLHSGAVRFHVIAQTNTPETLEWRARLQKEYGIETEPVMPPKPYEYPNIFDRSGFAKFAERHHLPVPYSKVAQDKPQLIAAYKEVASESGNQVVWAKLAVTGGGYGVNKVSNIAEVAALYDRFNALGILKLYGRQIPWEMQAHIDKIAALCSWQYQGNRIITPGDFTLQYMDPNEPSVWIGNGYNLTPPGLFPEMANALVADLQVRTTAALEEELGPDHLYAGGVDFAITKNRWLNYETVILEHNGARMSDSVMQVEAARSLGMSFRHPFATIKLGPAHCDINEVWQLLRKTGLSYSPDRNQGVVPFVWLQDPKRGYASIMIAAATAEELTRLYARSVETMKAEGMINWNK